MFPTRARTQHSHKRHLKFSCPRPKRRIASALESCKLEPSIVAFQASTTHLNATALLSPAPSVGLLTPPASRHRAGKVGVGRVRRRRRRVSPAPAAPTTASFVVVVYSAISIAVTVTAGGRPAPVVLRSPASARRAAVQRLPASCEGFLLAAPARSIVLSPSALVMRKFV